MSLFIGRLSRARMLSKGAGLGSSKTSFGLFSALEKSTKEDHIPAFGYSSGRKNVEPVFIFTPASARNLAALAKAQGTSFKTRRICTHFSPGLTSSSVKAFFGILPTIRTSTLRIFLALYEQRT